ncbi:amino acid adenylation domain-containing protein [Pseudomonas sp. 21LCFQ010]|uniref:amino acid adenylation domain-containing protein n=1 Tax=Pseudomonas sp. 21LCFQ010 TaxID=2957506 RepID=UPI0025B75B9B|nr:amino acid adenylation domain-containing protein [Pseudomonas sp. 21LCFQ010]
MNTETALKIAKRFVTLPTEKRKIYLEKMYAENLSPANLPVPEVQSLFDCIPLSFAQQRQWFLWKLNPDSATYNMPVVLRLSGSLSKEALQLSFQRLIERHEILRTTFHQRNGQRVQVVHAAPPFALSVEHLLPEQSIEAWVDDEVNHPFDLEQGPLLRIKLLGLADDEYLLILTMHHIVSDGWSMPVMVDELVCLYEAYSQGQTEFYLPDLPIQYADYAIWQRNWMEAGEQERQLTYWQGQLGGEQPVLELPTDRPRPLIADHRGARVAIGLNNDLVDGLKALAQRHGVTLFMVLLASFQSVLQRYSGQNDIRVGVPIANRTRVETERLIGFFVNTQVLKATFELTTTFDQLLKQVCKTVLDAQTYQDLPFEQLVEALQPDRSLSHNPLFQVMYNHQTQVKGTSRQVHGLKVEGYDREEQSAKFDLMLNTFEHESGIGASLTYATALFESSTIERLGRHWVIVLEQMVREPEKKISELLLLSAEEYQQVVHEWNPADVHYPAALCIHQLIEDQVTKTPEATALVFGTQSLSYAELNQRANRLAHKLRAHGVGPDVLVGIAAQRSIEMVVGLLGILKAGGAYVPLDPEYPHDRLSYMMQDSGIQVLLSQSHLLGQLPVPGTAQVVSLDELADGPATCSDVNPVNFCHPDNLAYMIYTSGSTGKPKGTLLTHHNVLRLFQATDGVFHFHDKDVWTVFHSYAFDFSVWELYGALLYGGRAVIVPKEVARSPESFHALLHREQVTVLNQTPSAFKQLIPVACASGHALALRYVVFGGEALDVGSLAPWFEHFGDQKPQLINMYGITETTVHVTYRPLSKNDLQQASVSPLGKVIPDLSWYLLDAQLNPVIPGGHGELNIGQAGLARGYHNRPALTAERFIPDPFNSSKQGGGRLYRSGDLGRSRVGGEIEYAGRIDHQVKIRGFRIELGEIETRIKEHPGIREAVVLDKHEAVGKQLVAYLVPVAGQDHYDQQRALRESLRNLLKAVMPDYMVPAHFVFLEYLPLTANGKLDRNALPHTEIEKLQSEYVAPKSEVEQQFAAIWADELKVARVGLADNFFELGGHSLLVMNIVSRVQADLGMSLPPSLLFKYPVLGDLLKAVEGAPGSKASLSSLEKMSALLDDMEAV